MVLVGKMTEKKQKQIFEDWLRQYRGLMFKIIHAYAFSEEDRNDLFQEVAIQLWRSVPNFKREAAETTWIYRVSLNTAIKWSTKENKHQSGRQEISKLEPVLEAKPTKIDERLDWLYREIGRLNEADRPLALLLLDGFSYNEMAEMLGISESNVGVKVHRIKKHLIKQSEKIVQHEL